MGMDWGGKHNQTEELVPMDSDLRKIAFPGDAGPDKGQRPAFRSGVLSPCAGSFFDLKFGLGEAGKSKGKASE